MRTTGIGEFRLRVSAIDRAKIGAPDRVGQPDGENMDLDLNGKTALVITANIVVPGRVATDRTKLLDDARLVTWIVETVP